MRDASITLGQDQQRQSCCGHLHAVQIRNGVYKVLVYSFRIVQQQHHTPECKPAWAGKSSTPGKANAPAKSRAAGFGVLPVAEHAPPAGNPAAGIPRLRRSMDNKRQCGQSMPKRRPELQGRTASMMPHPSFRSRRQRDSLPYPRMLRHCVVKAVPHAFRRPSAPQSFLHAVYPAARRTHRRFGVVRCGSTPSGKLKGYP